VSTLPAREANNSMPSRDPLRADTPDLYGTWREYAFSHAVELSDDQRAVGTPLEGIPTV